MLYHITLILSIFHQHFFLFLILNLPQQSTISNNYMKEKQTFERNRLGVIFSDGFSESLADNVATKLINKILSRFTKEMWSMFVCLSVYAFVCMFVCL